LRIATSAVIGRNSRPVWHRGRAAHLLEVQALHEHHTVETGHGDERRRQRNDHGAGTEQVQRHHRVSPLRLGDQERPRANSGEDERRDDLWIAVAVGAALDHAVGETDQRHDHGELTNEVEGMRPSRRVRHPSQEGERQGTDGEVDDEDEAPVQLGQDATEDRAGRCRDRPPERPVGDRLGPLARVVVRLADQRQ
jgi:hypothetical protein